MNLEELKVWEQDARRALSGRYSAEEIEIIMEWFAYIKGQEERELVGNEAVEGMLVFVNAKGRHDLYNSLMARAFVYAPHILEEHKARRAAGLP
jgi:hypothetical protein